MVIHDDAVYNSKIGQVIPEMRTHLKSFCLLQNKKTKTYMSEHDFDLLADFIHYVTKAVEANGKT